jgi:hypothetical protein
VDDTPHAEVADQEAVRSWLAAYAGHWNVDYTEAEVRGRLEVVARFCAFADEEPDALVASLFRDTPEGPRIRAKRRKEVIALIETFERSQSGDARDARRQANIVRSFLIHNGVAFSAGAMY